MSIESLERYLVGGAVRDEALGLAVVDRDWVVVGAAAEQLRKIGLIPVGKDFPVFIDVESGEEYALARTERKTARGYTGFEFHASPDVTLEQDLERRDLTINAMAKSISGELIDPFNGMRDLKHRVLRHVSPAFIEDPVRILRVARFAARFDFAVAPETMELMQAMVENGEVDALVAERVWQELHKALQTKHPHQFIRVLRECGALARVFPELNALYGVPQTKTYHPEVDTGIHIEMVMQAVAHITDDEEVRFAALTHDLGKGLTDPTLWPSHKGHEKAGLPLIKSLCTRLRVPNRFRSLALAVGEYHLHMHKMFELKPNTIVKVFEQTRCINNAERAQQIADACLADARGRTGFETSAYEQASLFVICQAAAESVDAKAIINGNEATLDGEEIKTKLRDARARAVEQARKEFVLNQTERT